VDDKLRPELKLSQMLVMTPQLQMAIKLLATPTAALPALVDEWRASHPGCVEELPIGARDPAEEREREDAPDEPPFHLLDESPLPVVAADVWVFGDPPEVHANGRAFPRLVATGDSTEARWFIKALRRRAQTYETVVRALVMLRPEAIDGKLAKKVATRELATAVGMHESTIGRVILACIFQTPHGVFSFTGKQQLGIARR
jgi:DNA-directed RNA polymerase specialized sigma54-like protein